MYKGQLFSVSDRQGSQKNSYDFRGRVLKATRYLSVNSGTYTIQSGYDDADRVTNVVYPGGATRLVYRYDNANNLTNVSSTCGVTSSNEVFYSAPVFDELGRVIQFKYGNRVTTVVSNYPNSKRLYGIKATPSGASAVQNLSYTYDKVANVKSINDAVYAGSNSGSLSSIGYDNLHRLTGYTWNGTTHAFTYNSIGNILTSSEAPGGTYGYGTKPHAVTSAGGSSFAYDASGNMTNRTNSAGNLALSYDEENQLIQTVGSNTVTYGYADGGARLWKRVGGSYTVYIGGVFEVRQSTSKTLCHVFAGGTRIATFEPQGGVCAALQTNPYTRTAYACL